MPAGVEVLVEDGLATIEFVDNSKRGVGVGALLKAGGPESVHKVTRPRTAYVVPEGVARAAGLLDESGGFAKGGLITPSGAPAGDSVLVQLDSGYVIPGGGIPNVGADGGAVEVGKTYDDGKPDADWSRPALNEYATKIGIPDAHKLPNKPAVIKAIADRQAESTPDSGK